ncbi:unnamed protein product [Phytomonas sp. EM1]|nr:unnamed protein product [Phytomonas sp. EM1]|eukprot:CCW62453.1 unnamed protein product [Phytomonas sp. isolate EM1]
MRGPRKGYTSSFAAAAKVIFDSARKTGVVNKLERSDKPIIHYRKGIHGQNKAHGSSLGGVSYKVVEFLATQRPSLPLKQQPSVKSFSKKVPHLDIPSIASPVKIDSSLSTYAITATSAADKKKDSSEKTGISKTVVSSVEQNASRKDETQTQTFREEDEFSNIFEEIPIAEDKPLFETRSTLFTPQTNVATVKTIDEFVPNRLSEKASSSPPINAPVFDSISANEQTFFKAPLPNIEVETVSVDSWEKQREAELAELQRKRKEEADLLAAAQLERDHQTLGNCWVAERTEVVTEAQYLPGQMSILRDIYFSTSIEESLRLFKTIIDLGSQAALVIPAASLQLLSKLRRLDCFERYEFTDQFVKLLESSKVSEDVKNKLKLVVYGGQNFITIFNALSEDSKKTLDKTLVKKAVITLLRHKSWEEAIRLVETSKTLAADPTNQLDIILVKHSYYLDDQARAEVVAFATKNITATGRMGKDAKLALASAEKGFQRKHLLQQLASSTSADENEYAELIRRTSRENIQELLSEMVKRGLNKNDPKILEAVAFRTINTEAPMLVFKEIDEQIRCNGIRPMHVLVAIKAARVSPREDVLRAALKIVKLIPGFRPANTLRSLTPLLFTHKMYSEIAELADTFGKYVPILKALPNVVALINDALRDLGREPLSELSSKDINFSPRALNIAVDSDYSSSSNANPGVDVSAIAETMFIYARDKQWEKALETLAQVKGIKASNVEALTLIYNCALGAAVDKPDVSLSVYEIMREREVPINVTTVNTLLTTLGKSPQWERAIEIFNELDVAYRDVNTYLIILSVLGRHNRWEDAISVFNQAKKAFNKPPLSVFTLAIGAVSNHSWSETLRIFQELMRHHSSSVKDNVVYQVIRCLEQNGRAAEIVVLQKLLEKKRKKKT